MCVCTALVLVFIYMLYITVIFRVYCADHTYCTLRFPIATTAETIKINAADKLGLKYPREELVLVELKSTGERITYRDSEVGVATALSLNGRLFVSPRDHLDALVSLFFFLCYQQILQEILVKIWSVQGSVLTKAVLPLAIMV